MAYYPLSGASFVADGPCPMRYVVRAPNAAALAGQVREAVRRLDASLPLFGVETLDPGRAGARDAGVRHGPARRRGCTRATARRRRPIRHRVLHRRATAPRDAIRMVVGVQVGHVRRLVLAEAGGLALVGVTLAVGPALALQRVVPLPCPESELRVPPVPSRNESTTLTVRASFQSLTAAGCRCPTPSPLPVP